eukprot:TRINITY_DN12319_c0_g1_i1.p1 TRINITY_DN12319_c0_g1~~TRINITY_DN12319_c0_g1_i1.p1  ORF type:complete len:539 (+),score=104.80 TRINITY_DN12319_c0_g1_i1:98-1714(+)
MMRTPSRLQRPLKSPASMKSHPKITVEKPISKDFKVGGEALPSSRSRHSSTSNNDTIFIFGGKSQRGVLSDLFSFCKADLSWTLCSTHGDVPCGRSDSSLLYFDKRLYLIGGQDGDGRVIPEALSLNLNTMQWSRLQFEKPLPFCYGQAGVVYTTDLILFGGCDGHNWTNDVHTIDTLTLETALVDTTGAIPSSRGWHSLTMCGQTAVLVGGYDGTRWLNDVYLLDMQTLVWTQLQTAINTPSPRGWHGAVSIANRVYVVGGYNGSTWCQDHAVLDVRTQKWEPIMFRDMLSWAARHGHSCQAIDKDIYVFGGYDGIALKQDLHVIETDTHIQLRNKAESEKSVLADNLQTERELRLRLDANTEQLRAEFDDMNLKYAALSNEFRTTTRLLAEERNAHSRTQEKLELHEKFAAAEKEQLLEELMHARAMVVQQRSHAEPLHIQIVQQAATIQQTDDRVRSLEAERSVLEEQLQIQMQLRIRLEADLVRKDETMRALQEKLWSVGGIDELQKMLQKQVDMRLRAEQQVQELQAQLKEHR